MNTGPKPVQRLARGDVVQALRRLGLEAAVDPDLMYPRQARTASGT